MVKLADNDYRMLCGKCDGTGTVEYHMDYAEGICFDCDGRGHWKTKYTLNGALREQERAKAKAEQERLEWEAGKAEREENARLAAIAKAEEDARKAEALIAEQNLHRWLDGEIGQFVEVVAKKLADKWFETQFGGNAFNLYEITTEIDGEMVKHKIVSFTTSGLYTDCRKGETARIRVKIKDFDIHDGFRQTLVTHGKVLEVLETAEVSA